MKCNLCDSDKILYSHYQRVENNILFTLSKCLECSIIFKTNPKAESIDLLNGQYYKIKSLGNTSKVDHQSIDKSNKDNVF